MPVKYMSHLGRKVFYRLQKVSLAIIVNIAKSATDKCVNELVNVNFHLKLGSFATPQPLLTPSPAVLLSRSRLSANFIVLGMLRSWLIAAQLLLASLGTLK